MPRKKKPRPIAVIDFETDPFRYGRVPMPFCVEFYSDSITEVFWGDDCGEQLMRFLENLEEPHVIYAHNGGKFDFHFMHGYIESPILIIKNRIVKAQVFRHELRDSFAILPVPLAQFGVKLEFDYDKMERHCRELHKDEILNYLHVDCLSLYEAVTAFVEKYGRRLTIGGTAMTELKKLHPFKDQGSRNDAQFRPYYFGGRVECFKAGVLEGPWKLFDVNSMYPYAMANFNHPINGRYENVSHMPDDFERPFFLQFRGKNRAAIPVIDEDGGLSFRQKEGVFFACSHEIQKALEYELIDIEEVINCYVALEYTRFDEFVYTHAALKEEAKKLYEAGSRAAFLDYWFEKLLMNSGYGRAGINPANFEDWIVHRDFGNEYLLEYQGYSQKADYDVIELWSKPSPIKEKDYCDVAIAASITSAARSILLEGIQFADTPIYCDTDSLICRDFHGDIDKYRLGAWDLEKEADKVCIAGKKLYAMWQDGKCHKISSKGGTLTGEEIERICNGEVVSYDNPAPSFSLHRSTRFISRHFRITTDLEEELA